VVTLEGRSATFKPVPSGLTPELRTALADRFSNGLYSHQSEALQAVLDGRDVCVATATASGKSLVFMTASVDALLRDRTARVLALYPAKALIQDQLEKWNEFLHPFDERAGFIDGSVAKAVRPGLLASRRVIAMTPDVAHAWLMSNLATPEVRQFLAGLRLLVLDEAHVYDGAFGTNMAYFVRRLTMAAKRFQMICSTATIGAPADFMQQLTGREMVVFDSSSDGSALSEKTLLLSPSNPKGGFDKVVHLLAALAQFGQARFLAFGDSRKAVERIVGAVLRESPESKSSQEDDDIEGDGESDSAEEFAGWPKLEHVLPYRAGYETTDRDAIQKALVQGTLAGVVSTSALELGLDIGDLDLVVLLNTPPTLKSFRQRIGRAGRRRSSLCILVDDQRLMQPLSAYLERPSEPSWLYLDNRYIQYSNALCAAVEFQARGLKSTAGQTFDGLPDSFPLFVENEINPTQAVPPDLYGLKQRAQSNPHYEFPIRSAAEPNFKVEGPFGLELGSLSYGQALREAYPGAVYYYMARPFRIQSLQYKQGRIKATKSRYFTTKPLTDTMAFPDFKSGIINAWRSPDGFVAEVELQVNERVKGFVEQRGQTKIANEYGPGSPYSQKPLLRSFKTTGICWAFPEKLDRSEAVATAIMQAFAFACGVHERDLGVALVHANEGPYSPDQVKGAVVFDATNGSLRLTERLGRQFAAVITGALEQADMDSSVQMDLMTLQDLAAALEPVGPPTTQVEPVQTDGDWVRVIARQQPALYMSGDEPVEVTVVDFRYTPHGLMYQLEPLKEAGFTQTANGSITPRHPMKWMVLASAVQPLAGTTAMIRHNVMTGEEAPEVAAG
jgi:DEAD/DEAH box helicase domain-containing protein